MTALAEPINHGIERLEEKLLQYPQLDCPLKHEFAPGVYLRTITMPAGSCVIGHEHKTKHFNIVHRGRALVSMDGDVTEIVAPACFVSEPGVRKVLLVAEECEWSTVHPTDETDLAKLEEELIVKSPIFYRHLRDILRLKELAEKGGR